MSDNHTTATVERKGEAYRLRCWCGLTSGWHALLSTCVTRQTDHANQHARGAA